MLFSPPSPKQMEIFSLANIQFLSSYILHSSAIHSSMRKNVGKYNLHIKSSANQREQIKE